MPPPVVQPPSVLEVMAEMSRRQSPPPAPMTPEQRQANWEFLRSGAGLPVPGGHMLPSTMAPSGSDPLATIPWADRQKILDVAKQWVVPSPSTPIAESLPAYQPAPPGTAGPVEHVGILALASRPNLPSQPRIGALTGKADLEAHQLAGGSIGSSGLEISQIPDPVYIVRTNSWPWTVKDHWGLPQKIGWLTAIMHPYLVFPYWKNRLGEATTLLFEQEAGGRVNKPL